MAEATTANIDGTAPPKEVEPSLEEMAASYSSPTPNAPKDIVSARYRILLNRPIEEFNSNFAQAYEAEDIEQRDTNIYALICTNNLPYRMQGIEALKNSSHPSICKCLAAAPTPLSTPDETRMVMVVERPLGQKLSEFVAQNGPMNERAILQRVMKPLNEALSTLTKYNINHGCINPDTIYISNDSIKIKEPVSEPSGYSQIFWYEAPERLFSNPAGKGSGNAAADAYAMAVLFLFMYYGRIPIDKLSRKQFEERILQMGGYHTFTQQIDISEMMSDLLRGAMSENQQERWNHDHIASWLDGKRFNLILPSIPRDSARAFQFNGEDYFSYRALAHSIYTNWDTAKTQLAAVKLVKWMETNANRVELADAMSRVLRNYVEGEADDKPLTDEEVCKIIAILDPPGPMRYKDVSTNIDGLGKSLAASIKDKNNLARQQYLTLIDIGHPAFLADLMGQSTSNVIATNALWQMKTLRPMLKMKTLGFGMERIVYNLNPSLTCQSSIVLKYHPANLTDVLQILDRIAPTAMKKTSLVDANLAAYITAKLEINKEVKVVELSAHPDLVTDARLVILKLLMLAQQKQAKNSPPPYKGLALWVASMILPITEKINQKSAREDLVYSLKKAASTGQLEKICSLIFRDRLFTDDRLEYEKARSIHKYHEESVKQLRDKKRLAMNATLHGRYFNVAMGYIALVLSLYFSFSNYVRL